MNKQYAMRHLLLILSVVWVGCFGEHELEQSVVQSPIETASDTDPSLDVELDWVPGQGIYVLGSVPDSLGDGPNFISASLVPVNRPAFRLSVAPSSSGARLVADADSGEHHEGADLWFNGMTLAVDSGRITIRAVGTPVPHHVEVEGVVPQPTSTLYALNYSARQPDGSYAPPVDYCDNRGGTVVFAGVFDRTTRIHHEADKISFGCGNGIALKCMFWGYRPGNGGAASKDWKYHQSCMGTGGANYCGNGMPHTRERTPIQIRDNLANYGSDGLYELTYPVTQPGNLDTFYIEGGWDATGKPTCLAQSRWEALKPICPPGTTEPPRCDGKSMSQLFNDGALIVDGAATMDATLKRWQNPDTKDTVLTVRGFFRAGTAGAPDLLTPPFPGYTKYLGTYGMLMRTLPGNLSKTLMRPIYMQNLAGGDRYLSDVPGLQGSFEGYAFRNQDTITPDVVILNLPAFRQCTWTPTDRDSGVEGFSAGCTPDVPPRSLGFALPPPPSP